ncbi:MAG TPA: DUF2059 domain-containing protein [Myxococcales bacterium]|nr:DUF2059 domain-containing protein [Myxococcales bacterium]
MRTSAAAFTLLLCLSASADAPSAAYMDAVRVMMPRARYDAMIEGMYRPLVATAEANSKTKMPEDSVQILKRAAESSMSYDELLRWTADAYKRHFTPQDMQQLVAFFRSPLGMKLEKEQPKVFSEVMRKVSEVVPPRMEATLRKEAPAKKAP